LVATSAAGAGLTLVLHVRHDRFETVLAVFGVVCSSVIEVYDLVPLLNNVFGRELYIDWEAMAS
jgi:hypothetical protein